ncbi:calpain-9 isoform X3 [Phasianus colchicus]|uniref:calpain-9 isoform X3 n=1 Tax=Phasianus colchicus TaxID=9054 RepID=UPI00129E16F5|nr:calpain-9 isoform X3 [Phasianus colchicus]
MVNTWAQRQPHHWACFSLVQDEKSELAVSAEATPSCSSSFTPVARCHEGFPQELHTLKSSATSCPSPHPHWGSWEWCQAPGGPIATGWAQQPCPREGLAPPSRFHPSSWCGQARRFPSLFAFRVFIISRAVRSCSCSFLPLCPVLLDLSPLHFSLLGAMPYLLHDSKPRPPPLPQEARATHSSGKGYQELKQECLRSGCLFEDPDFPANNASLFFSEKPPIAFLWKRPGFWQHNEWLDVVIDDRLPTFKDRLVFVHSAEHNEFWSALLEKAYAKLNGSYEALKGGSTIEAMEDFTGGVGEMYEVKKAPDNFYEILEKALKRSSMVGCSIDTSSAAESEARTPFGLIKGHAYSVTGIDEVSYQGQKVQLIRIRNPWGQVEWNGPWSNNSLEWRLVSPSEQKRLAQTALDDGEFWMKFEDFKVHFDKVEICNLTPDALEDSTAHKWEVTIHEGSWVRGSTAGGCRNFLDTFWTNPQIKLHLTEKDDGQDDCTFIAALMQKDRRKLRKLGAEMLSIGYSIYESPGGDEHLSKDFFRYHASKARSKTYINLREVSDRFKLPPGDYILVPTTFEPHQEADFCLRIFSEKKAITEDLDENVAIDLPEPPNPTPSPQETEEEKQFRALFEQISGKDMEVAAEELEYVLNKVLKNTKNIKFKKLSLISCRNIISLMDTSGNGKLEFSEFKVFWEKLKKWINIFLRFDFDKSGSMSSYELRSALKAAGYQLNNYLLQLIVLRYSDEQFQIDFDDFLNCLIRLENASRVFQALSVKNKDFINLNIGEFINLAMNI